MNTEAHLLAIHSFINVLTRRLVEKGVFTQSEMANLHDAWFQEVFAQGVALEEAGDELDLDDVLIMIHSLALEFTPK